MAFCTKIPVRFPFRNDKKSKLNAIRASRDVNVYLFTSDDADVIDKTVE